MSVLESLFNKVVGLKACNLSKKWTQDRCISVFFSTPFFTEHLQAAASYLKGATVIFSFLLLLQLYYFITSFIVS